MKVFAVRSYKKGQRFYLKDFHWEGYSIWTPFRALAKRFSSPSTAREVAEMVAGLAARSKSTVVRFEVRS